MPDEQYPLTGTKPASNSGTGRAPERERVLAWGLGFIAAAIIVVATRGQTAVTADSVTYLSAADSLSSGEGLATWLEDPMVVFPPGWPAAIGALMTLGLSAEISALMLVALAAVATPPLTLLVIERTTTTVAARVLTLVTVSMTPTVLSWTLGALSEVPFIALMMGCIVVATRSSERPRLLWVAAALAGICPLVRYAGVAIPLGLALWVLVGGRFEHRWRTATAVLAVGIAPFALLAAWNLASAPSPFGEREPSTIGPFQVVVQGLRGIGRTFLWGVDAAPTALVVVMGTGIVGLCAVAALRVPAGVPAESMSTRRLVALIAATQLVVMATSRMGAEIDDLGPRLLAPATVLMFILCWSLFGDVESELNPNWRRIAVAMAAGWCIIGLGASARFILRDGADGYDGPSYRAARHTLSVDDALPASCAEHDPPHDTSSSGDPDCLLLANEPWAWYRSSLRPQLAPRAYGDTRTSDLAAIGQRLERGDEVYLLWTSATRPKSYLMTLEDLEDSLGVDSLDRTEDVSIYRITSAEP